MQSSEAQTDVNAEHMKLLGEMLAKLDANAPDSAFAAWEREFLRYWTPRMLRTFVESNGQRVFIDQDCTLRRDVPTAPLADVDARWRLTDAELAQFYRDGFIGPLTAISPAEMDVFRAELDAELARPSKTFGFQTVRDRHFDMPSMVELFRNPAITERLAQLLGPNLVMWRSQVFPQPPGAPAVTWHQASTYMVENYKRPLLEPADAGRLFQLTVWIAVDEATRENGCMQFVPGTHWSIRTARRGGAEGFFEARFRLEVDPDTEPVVDMELAPGQFVIFTERSVHGSPGNPSARRRMGVNFRAIRPDTVVYRDMTEHTAAHIRQVWSLAEWGVYVLRGRNEPAVNRLAPRADADLNAALPGQLGGP